MNYKNSLKLTLVFATLGLSACGISPTKLTKLSESTILPVDRVYAYNSPINGPSGKLIVIRDSGMQASGCYLVFSIDGKAAGRFEPKEKAIFTVPAKDLLISVENDKLGKGLCALSAENNVSRETSIKDGETKYYRLLFSGIGVLDVQRVANEELISNN